MAGRHGNALIQGLYQRGDALLTDGRQRAISAEGSRKIPNHGRFQLLPFRPGCVDGGHTFLA